MIIFPAIDLLGGKAVRLLRGDYNQVTVYSDRPTEVAADFVRQGATHLHLVDLDGARDGAPTNLATIQAIVNISGLFVEVGGGIRTMEAAKRYLECGVQRVILGTAAVTDEAFLRDALTLYGDKIAVGVDLKDGYVAIKGWTERTDLQADAFFAKMDRLGVSCIICTDISRDGAMQGANHALYQNLSRIYHGRVTASGGVSSMEDVRALREQELYGAIVGKAYYTGAIDLKEAIEVAR